MYNMEGYCTSPYGYTKSVYIKQCYVQHGRILYKSIYGNTKSVYNGQDATDGKSSTSFQYNTD
jgi:hypothetical protein